MYPIWPHVVAFPVGLFLISLGGAAFADEPKNAAPESECAREVALRVEAWADALPGLEARFEQTTEAVALGGGPAPPVSKSTGRLYFARPGRMRFDYEEPEPSQIVTDGSQLWIYDVGEREVQHLEVSSDYLSGAPLQFLMGEGKLLESFDVSAARCDSEIVDLHLVPRRDATYERLGLRVHRLSGEVSETTLVDLLGNRTRISYEKMRTDRTPPASLFLFEVPEGVEVIELRTSN